MAKTIRITLDNDSLDQAIKELRKYNDWITSKEAELRSRLAEFGKEVAEIRFGSAVYDGSNDVTVRVDDTGSTAVIYAEGKAVVFIEFGSGARYGSGHPMGSQFGYVPGSWSTSDQGKGHWDNPDGWYYAHGKKSHGNPPAMAMYYARNGIVENLTRIAREVFSQ